MVLSSNIVHFYWEINEREYNEMQRVEKKNRSRFDEFIWDICIEQSLRNICLKFQTPSSIFSERKEDFYKRKSKLNPTYIFLCSVKCLI